jgi:selenocysteine lyase/cysteine desulfurase
MIDGVDHALAAARLSAEWAIGVRHGCFCAHPYLIRLLGLSPEAVDAYRRRVLRKDHSAVPGAVRASCGISTTTEDVDALLAAVSELAHSRSHDAPVEYVQDVETGDYWPETDDPAWAALNRRQGAWCARG